jgi:hypothetical protein
MRKEMNTSCDYYHKITKRLIKNSSNSKTTKGKEAGLPIKKSSRDNV